MPPAGSPLPDHRALRWIGALQLGKGVLLIVLALGFLTCLHCDVDVVVASWLQNAGINVENRHVVALLDTLDLVTDKQIFQISIGAFFFAGVLVTQGTGLLLRRQWAKYLTLVATASLIPLEAFEMLNGFGVIKLSVLLVNILIVWVMFILLRRRQAAAFIPLPASSVAAFVAERPLT